MDNGAIEHPSAWTSAAIGGREGLTHRLSRAHRGALAMAAERIENRTIGEISTADFPDESIRELMQAVRFELRHGKGAIILSGLDIGPIGEELFGKLYWGLGGFLGRHAIQSVKGDLLGRVEQLEDNPAGRGYQSNIELGPHTDFHEILSLAGVRGAARGGESGLVSSLAIHEAIRRERPDLIPALEEGYWIDNGDGTNTPYKVPVFGRKNGVLSCYYHPMLLWNGAAQSGAELPEKLREGMELIREVAVRPELQARFTLEPGEMMFWHNFTVLHSRTHFENAPGQSRLILRQWIHADDKRPMPLGYIEKAEQIDAMHARGEAGLRYDLPALKAMLEKKRAREAAAAADA